MYFSLFTVIWDKISGMPDVHYIPVMKLDPVQCILSKLEDKIA